MALYSSTAACFNNIIIVLNALVDVHHSPYSLMYDCHLKLHAKQLAQSWFSYSTFESPVRMSQKSIFFNLSKNICNAANHKILLIIENSHRSRKKSRCFDRRVVGHWSLIWQQNWSENIIWILQMWRIWSRCTQSILQGMIIYHPSFSSLRGW